MTKLVIDPLTRVEGHFKIDLEVDSLTSRVSAGTVSGSMYRGLETVVLNRDPRDAAPILSAICGVCHSDHHIASVRAVENAAGMLDYTDAYSTEQTSIPANAVLSRNIIAGADWAYSHAAHLLALAGPDFHLYGLLSGPNAVAGVSTYQDLLRTVIIPAQQYMNQAITLWGGKSPHQRASVPGGNPVKPSADVVTKTREKIRLFRSAVDAVAPVVWNYLTSKATELGGLGVGHGNFISAGGFPDPTSAHGTDRMQLLIPRGVITFPGSTPSQFDPANIAEGTSYSWYHQSGSAQVTQGQGPAPDMSNPGAYTWVKTPTYGGALCETGPLARGYVSGLLPTLGGVIRQRNGSVPGLPLNPKGSVFDRMIARALELVALVGSENTTRNLQMLGEDLNLSLTDVLEALGLPVSGLMEHWLDGMDIGGPSYNPDYRNPAEAEGLGLWEAPRGALLHWVKVASSKVSAYQVVAPTTWNACHGGPLETSLAGTPVGQTGTNDDLRSVAYVVRSFDMCGACAVHAVVPGGSERYLRM